MKIRSCLLLLIVVLGLQAQERQTLSAASHVKPENSTAADGNVILGTGMRIPLRLLNGISTKNAALGNQVYLTTIVPIFVDRRLVIPVGSTVIGTITKAQRPGKVKGKGELYLTFDTLQLTNGAQIDLRSRLSGVDNRVAGKMASSEGKLEGDAGGGKDALVVAGSTVSGAAMGNWIGGQGRDAGIGAAAGAAAGLAAVLLTRGPEAAIPQGSTLEMELNHDLRLTADDLAGIGDRSRQRRRVR